MVPASFASATFRRAGAPGKLPIGLIVLLLCLGQVVLWGIATAYAYKAPELDSAEQFIWSFALEGGYWKHPPVPSWIMHFLVAVFGPSVPLPYIATQVAIVTAMALTWRLACEFMTPQRALIAMLLTSLVTYHNIGGDNYNHNTVLL
ncbi:MAG: glycosyltransferase family 39 protein, partial [Janthinobacterium lividum]